MTGYVLAKGASGYRDSIYTDIENGGILLDRMEIGVLSSHPKRAILKNLNPNSGASRIEALRVRVDRE